MVAWLRLMSTVSKQSVALDLASRDQAEADHYTEIRAFAKARTGCDFVLFFPQFGGIPPLPLSMRTTTPFGSYILTTLRGTPMSFETDIFITS